MELISNNSPEDIEARRLEEQANSVLVDLTANLLRVTRGSGRPELILRHVFDLSELARRHFELKRQWPSFWDVLSLGDPRTGEEPHPVRDATDAMLRGALQTVASRLLGQIPQEARGQTELFQGVHGWADAVDFRAAAPRGKQPPRQKTPSLSNEWDDVVWDMERSRADEQERQRKKKLTTTERIAERRSRAEALGRVKRERKPPNPSGDPGT